MLHVLQNGESLTMNGCFVSGIKAAGIKKKKRRRGSRRGGGGREGRGRERENSKTLTLKGSSVRSIWTYLTASPCYTTNTNKHDYTTNRYYKHECAVD